MGVGHIGLGLAAKRMEPGISLGTWILAVMLADLICFPLLMARVERFHVVESVARNRIAGDIPYSHSLLMDALWGALFALTYFLWRRNRRGALLLCAAVLSHWVLDVVSHRPDMQIAPGIRAALGLGLWNSIPATLVVEGGLWAIGIAIYVRVTRAKGMAGGIAFWSGIILLTLSWWSNIYRGMDPDPVRAGAGGLIFFSLVVAWAYWMNRVRSWKATPAPRAV